MKKDNLTREEAMKAMIDGQLVGHKNFAEGYVGMEPRYDGRPDFYYKPPYKAKEPLESAMFEEDGYYIIEPEPKFKEVVMYAPVGRVSRSCEIYGTNSNLYTRPVDAMEGIKEAIGYAEIKVFLKDEE